MASSSTPSAGASMQPRPGGAAPRSPNAAAGASRRACSATTRCPSSQRQSRPMSTYRVGVDIGGTFTDIVLVGADGAVHTKKISSSVEDYARAIVDGLAELFAERSIAPGAIEEVRHGTTVASN